MTLTMPLPAQPRLLLIDDSMPDLRVLTEIATARGWSVSVAFNGKDGYHKALMADYDLILLDVCMPGLDGLGTCRMLKANEQTRKVPVIFLSAAGEQQNRLDGLLLGAVDYIVKSYANEEEIAARIAIHLQKANYLAYPARASAEAATSEAVLVKAATKILLEQMAAPPEANVLAQRLGTSEKRLNEAFRLQFGLTTFGWLREERLRLGRLILATTDAAIVDIAANLGYSSPQNFATAFRERFEVTPKAFRQGQRKVLVDSEAE